MYIEGCVCVCVCEREMFSSVFFGVEENSIY
jgi:hypothetical protein